ncbi:MAG: tetratricopeptide repeat protein [Defluviicoccus sp.]|nr:tetratricopeptide repeat protein [Defluviicoccus sp.]MDE0382982.1 tetratricopeptide repeat protein [Defluviicoccus sp.]
MAARCFAAATGRARRRACAILSLAAGIVLLPAAGGDAGDAGAPTTSLAKATGRTLELGSYLAGHHAFRTRDFGAAARYLSEAVAAEPGGRRLLLRALIAKLASGEAEAARALARRLLALEPDAPLALLSLAVGEFKAGRFEAARTRLATIGGRGPNAFTVPLLSAWAEAALGRYDAARAALPGTGDNAAFAPFRSLHGALMLDLAGRAKEAKELYLEAADQAGRPTVRLVQAIGSFYRRFGDAAEAERRYTAFVAGESRSPLIERALGDLRAGRPATPIVANGTEGAAEALLDGARMGLRARSIEMALVYGRLALELRPDFPSARVLVGQILESVGRDEEAVEVYGSVNRASPLSWSARLSRAAGLARLGRDEEAIELLRRMADERAARTDALSRLGDIFRNRKRFAEAVEAYDAAIARIGSVEQRHWRLLFSRGIALERSKNWPRAEKDFLAALELSPDEPYLLNYLGYSWVDQGIKLTDARRMIERAVELEPQSGAIVDSLGWALYRIGDYDGAVEQLERASELEPLDPTVNDHLGDAYWRVGRRNEAMFQWRRALNLDPELDQVPIIENKLARGLSDI